jgi:hypothetical protein
VKTCKKVIFIHICSPIYVNTAITFSLYLTQMQVEPTMHLHLEQSLMERIRKIDAKDPYPKKRGTSTKGAILTF